MRSKNRAVRETARPTTAPHRPARRRHVRTCWFVATDKFAESPTSASARPASRSVRSAAPRTNAADTNSAAPLRRFVAREARKHRARSLRRLAILAASPRHIEKHFLQRVTAVALAQARRRVVILDAALLHENHPLAQPLHLGHVVRGDQ